MATRKKKTPKVHAAASLYIDPLDCDSTISYKVVSWGSGRLSGSVTLSDCQRRIEWYFRDTASSVGEIDAAIKALQGFRAEFVAAQKLKRSRKKTNVR